MHLGTMKKIYCVSIQSQMCMSIKSQISLKKCRKEEGKKGLNSKCFEHEIDQCSEGGPGSCVHEGPSQLAVRKSWALALPEDGLFLEAMFLAQGGH